MAIKIEYLTVKHVWAPFPAEAEYETLEAAQTNNPGCILREVVEPEHLPQTPYVAFDAEPSTSPLTPAEQEWLESVVKAESAAWRTISMFAKNWTKDTGFTTAKHVIDYIKRLEDKITESVGDCPE